MVTIDIDYKTYLPAPSVYLAYFELLKSHNFIENLETNQEIFDLFLETFVEELDHLEK
ncbi:hypothetical protein [Candidatus Lokiarchaeum ossiferum]|uniref:hypothetical protein n=1 Tax=Candidatus Lokiarchaeum ossiferum TaxID=2951803 RepID=UPI00352EEA13